MKVGYVEVVAFYRAALAIRTGYELLKRAGRLDLHLVTTGFFARVRHPTYLGFTLWILGWAVFQGAVVSFAVGLVGIGNILFWRHLEEQHLETSYGETYRSNRARTWF